MLVYHFAGLGSVALRSGIDRGAGEKCGAHTFRPRPNRDSSMIEARQLMGNDERNSEYGPVPWGVIRMQYSKEGVLGDRYRGGRPLLRTTPYQKAINQKPHQRGCKTQAQHAKADIPSYHVTGLTGVALRSGNRSGRSRKVWCPHFLGAPKP